MTARDNEDLLNSPHDRAYEEQFIKAHRKHSFFSSLYFAVAGASFIGVLGTFTNKVMQAVEDGTKPFKSSKSPVVMGAMMAVGVGFTYLSNKRETEKVRLEDMRLARRFAKDQPFYSQQPQPIAETQPDNYWQQKVAAQDNIPNLQR